MAHIKFKLSTKKNSGAEKTIQVEISVVVNGKLVHNNFRTKYTASVEQWNEKTQRIRISKLTPKVEAERIAETNKALSVLSADIEQLLLSGYSKEKLAELICGKRIDEQEAQEAKEQALWDDIRAYAEQSKLADRRKEHYFVLGRMVQRYCEYNKITLYASQATTKDIEGVQKFIEEEHEIAKTAAYQKNVEHKADEIKERGGNRVVVLMKLLRAFFNGIAKQGRETKSPFKGFKMQGEIYGTPYYITQEELNKIYSTQSSWDVQRDIFVFQCCIGCRVSDLRRLTWENVQQDDEGRWWVSYIPNKTKNESARVARVPLNDMAVEIMMRYKDCKGWGLLPTISQQKYNDNIKRIFEEAGIVRKVTIRDAKRGEDKQVRICDVASSHIARRAFCGGMYNSGVDSRVICAMSGHAEGSRAFNRYVKPSDEQLINAVMKGGKQ